MEALFSSSEYFLRAEKKDVVYAYLDKSAISFFK
jgi:hypothetical protein